MPPDIGAENVPRKPLERTPGVSLADLESRVHGAELRHTSDTAGRPWKESSLRVAVLSVKPQIVSASRLQVSSEVQSMANKLSFKRHPFPPDVIRYAVWLLLLERMGLGPSRIATN